MPYIHIMNTDEKLVRKFREHCISEIVDATDIPGNVIHTIYHSTAIESESQLIYVKVEWLEKPKESEQKVEKIIREFFNANGYSKVAIYFAYMHPERYYFSE